MKKFLIGLMFALIGCSAFSESLDYERFCMKIYNKWSWVEDRIGPISQETWEEWKGDADAFIQHYTENPICGIVGEEK